METVENNGEKPCPLCNIPSREVLAEGPRWRLARTKTMKRHSERLMINRITAESAYRTTEISSSASEHDATSPTITIGRREK